jgi:protein-tyrosine phosphatase
MIGWLRRLARESIQSGERLLHHRRHRRALHVLAALRAPRSIVVVCLGNICRSPYAGHRLDRELSLAGLDAVDVRSAGFIQPGRPSPAAARRVAARRGLDLTDHRSRLVTPSMLREVDLVLAMSPRQRRQLRQEVAGEHGGLHIILGDLDPEPIDRRTIVDPFGEPDEVFEAVYERIDRCCRALVGALTGTAAGPGARKESPVA